MQEKYEVLKQDFERYFVARFPSARGIAMADLHTSFCVCCRTLSIGAAVLLWLAVGVLVPALMSQWRGWQ